MTDKQPEALRLAARLDPVHSCQTQLLDLHREAAAELRRLHAENAALLADRRNLGAAIERQHSAAEQIADQVMRLEDQCGALLDALKEAEPFLALGIRKKARAAIAKAEGKNQ